MELRSNLKARMHEQIKDLSMWRAEEHIFLGPNIFNWYGEITWDYIHVSDLDTPLGFASSLVTNRVYLPMPTKILIGIDVQLHNI